MQELLQSKASRPRRRAVRLEKVCTWRSLDTAVGCEIAREPNGF